jgi:hypothetical protein
MAKRAAMQEQQCRAERRDGLDPGAGQCAKEPGEPGEREEKTDPAAGLAGRTDEPAPNERPPHGEVGRGSEQALPRPGEPFRRETQYKAAQPGGDSKPPSGAGQGFTR